MMLKRPPAPKFEKWRFAIFREDNATGQIQNHWTTRPRRNPKVLWCRRNPRHPIGQLHLTNQLYPQKNQLHLIRQRHRTIRCHQRNRHHPINPCRQPNRRRPISQRRRPSRFRRTNPASPHPSQARTNRRWINRSRRFHRQRSQNKTRSATEKVVTGIKRIIHVEVGRGRT